MARARRPVRLWRRPATTAANAYDAPIDEETADALANIVGKLERLAAAQQALEALQERAGSWVASGDQVYVLVPEAALDALVEALLGD
jgi:hypothetical protein